MTRQHNPKSTEYCLKDLISRAASVLFTMIVTLILVLGLASSDLAYAISDDDIPDPLREVHMVTVGDQMFCFFVQQTVVLTPAEIAELDDNEIVAEVLLRSGLYMKETNCRRSKSKVVTVAEWIKGGGSFLLDIEDINRIREAEPVDGEPVKLYMDLKISTEQVQIEKPDDGTDPDDPGEGTDPDDPGEGTDPDGEPGTDGGQGQDQIDGSNASGDQLNDPGDPDDPSGDPDDPENPDDPDNPDDPENPDDPSEDPDDPYKDIPIYSTHKLIGGHLLLVEVATEEDAKLIEDICKKEKEEQKKKKKKPEEPEIPDIGGDRDEILPEFRTINMVDRSGPPIKPTLQDGTPVTLEWIEPEKEVVDSGILTRVPGGLAGLLVISGATIAAIAFAAARIRKRRSI